MIGTLAVADRRGDLATKLWHPPMYCAGCDQLLANDGTNHVVVSRVGADHHVLYHPGCCPCRVAR